MRMWLACIATVLMLGCTASPNGGKLQSVGTDVSGVGFGKDFLLTDHTGKQRRLTDFRGKVVALFFGYTHCPDVCPTTMVDLAQAVKLLGERGKDVQVLFVTLDPERDTPQVLAMYVPAFNPSFLGLSGDAETTARTAQDFKVFLSKQVSNSRAGYLIDHSAGVYVFDKKGELRLFVNYGQKAKDIAHDFDLLI